MFSVPELLGYIEVHSETKTKPIIKFHETDYREGIDEEKESFDLLISLSSGFVSQYCGSYLKREGVLFANNEHYDATKAFIDENFLVIGVFTHGGKLVTTDETIQKYFLITKNQQFTRAHTCKHSSFPNTVSLTFDYEF
jgi:hypothetical protein